MSMITSDYILVSLKRPKHERKDTIPEGEQFVAQRISKGNVLVYSPFGPPRVELLSDYEIVGQMETLTMQEFWQEEIKEYKEKCRVLQLELDKKLKIEKVLVNNQATIVFFSDGTKEVSVLGKDERRVDFEKAVMSCCAKRFLGGYTPIVEGMNKVEIITQVD